MLITHNKTHHPTHINNNVNNGSFFSKKTTIFDTDSLIIDCKNALLRLYKYSILRLLFNYGEKRNISLFSAIKFNGNLYFWAYFNVVAQTF